jgi:hypothetical protein
MRATGVSAVTCLGAPAFGAVLLLASSCLPSGEADLEASRGHIQTFEKADLLAFCAAKRETTLTVNTARSPLENSDAAVDYRSNTSFAWGVAAGFGNNSFSLSVDEGAPTLDVETHGRTDYFDLAWRHCTRRYSLDVFYYDYSGLYSDCEGVVDYRPDLRVSGFGGNLYYVFNRSRFSFPAAFNHTERQLHEASTFLLLGSVAAQWMTSDDTLIPPALQPELGGLAGLREAAFYSVSAAPGYGHVFVGKGAERYVLVAVFAGYGLEYYDYDAGPETGNGVSSMFKLMMELAYGEQNEAVYVGASATFDSTGSMLDEGTLNFQYTQMSFFVGWRF